MIPRFIGFMITRFIGFMITRFIGFMITRFIGFMIPMKWVSNRNILEQLYLICLEKIEILTQGFLHFDITRIFPLYIIFDVVLFSNAPSPQKRISIYSLLSQVYLSMEYVFFLIKICNCVVRFLVVIYDLRGIETTYTPIISLYPSLYNYSINSAFLSI